MACRRQSDPRDREQEGAVQEITPDTRAKRSHISCKSCEGAAPTFAKMPLSRNYLALFLSISYVISARGEGPSLPDGVLPLLSKLQALSGKYGADQDDQARLQQLRERSQIKVSQAMEDQHAQDALAQAAYLKVSERILRSRFVGGCPRNFAGCPEDWEMVGNTCQPSAAYGGPCQSFDILSFPSNAAKEREAFALECRLSWPCEASCTRDFSGCPHGWQGSADSCVAPSSYKGICSRTTRFSGYSIRQKAEWAALCDATWPCAGGSLTASTASVNFLAARSMPIDAYKIRNSIPLTVSGMIHPWCALV